MEEINSRSDVLKNVDLDATISTDNGKDRGEANLNVQLNSKFPGLIEISDDDNVGIICSNHQVRKKVFMDGSDVDVRDAAHPVIFSVL